MDGRGLAAEAATQAERGKRVRTVIKYEARGDGTPTPGELIAALSEFPADAKLQTLRLLDSQRDGVSWEIVAVVVAGEL